MAENCPCCAKAGRAAIASSPNVTRKMLRRMSIASFLCRTRWSLVGLLGRSDESVCGGAYTWAFPELTNFSQPYDVQTRLDPIQRTSLVASHPTYATHPPSLARVAFRRERRRASPTYLTHLTHATHLTSPTYPPFFSSIFAIASR